MKMKDKLGKIGKNLDESIQNKTSIGVEIAKKTAKNVAIGAASVVTNVGKTIEEKAKKGKQDIKDGLEIKDDMTTGQKAGKVMEKFVDFVDKKIQDVTQKMSESQADKFATIEDMKTKINPDILIGQEKGAVTKERVNGCKDFLARIVKNKVALPYKLKDLRKTIINDIIISASTNWNELLKFLLDKEVPESTAAINFLEKEIKIVKEVQDNENKSKE